MVLFLFYNKKEELAFSIYILILSLINLTNLLSNIISTSLIILFTHSSLTTPKLFLSNKSLIHRAKTTHLNYYQKYGYYFDSNGKEQIDEYSSSIVKFIFDLASNGKTTTEISKILNDNNILTRSKYAVEMLKLKPLNKKPSEQWNTSKV